MPNKYRFCVDYYLNYVEPKFFSLIMEYWSDEFRQPPHEEVINEILMKKDFKIEARLIKIITVKSIK